MATLLQIDKVLQTQLSKLIGTDEPKLIQLIKIFGTGSVLFIATQILRRIWYTVYHKYKKYPPGML